MNCTTSCYFYLFIKMESYNQPMMKPNPKANSGVVKRGYDASIDKTGKLFSRISPFSKTKETLNSSDDSTDQHQSNETNSGRNDSPNEKIKHNSSFNKDNSIVTKNGENFKQSQKKDNRKIQN